MSRFSTSLLVAAALAAIPASAAAVQQQHSTFKGDGFDASVWSYDGCQQVSLNFYGSDYSTKAGPGQPQSSNYMSGWAQIYDSCQGSWGSASIDLSGAAMNARGPNASTTFSGSVEVESYHYEQDTVETCYSWEASCWTDWDGSEYCQEAGENCYLEWHYVADPSKTLSFDLSIAPSGDAYRGMSMNSSKGPFGMYRYRYTGTQKYGSLAGTLTLNGQPLSIAQSWANVWTATSGSLSVSSVPPVVGEGEGEGE